MEGTFIAYISEHTDNPNYREFDEVFKTPVYEYETVGHRFRSDYIYISVKAVTNLNCVIEANYITEEMQDKREALKKQNNESVSQKLEKYLFMLRNRRECREDLLESVKDIKFKKALLMREQFGLQGNYLVKNKSEAALYKIIKADKIMTVSSKNAIGKEVCKNKRRSEAKITKANFILTFNKKQINEEIVL